MRRGAAAGAAMLLAVAACNGAPVGQSRWEPPVAGPLPEAVVQREPLPFCGVATARADPVFQCIVDAWQARRPAEAGVVIDPREGRTIGVVRVLSDTTIELFLGDASAPSRAWRHVRCDGLRPERPDAVLSIPDCDPEELLPVPEA